VYFSLNTTKGKNFTVRDISRFHGVKTGLLSDDTVKSDRWAPTV
jgi:hypothetical protein